MGNSECQRCLSAEREMFAEILMGKDKDNNIDIHNNTGNNNKIKNNSYSNIKKISEEIPPEIISNKNKNKENINTTNHNKS